jgi:hypothetical protein
MYFIPEDGSYSSRASWPLATAAVFLTLMATACGAGSASKRPAAEQIVSFKVSTAGNYAHLLLKTQDVWDFNGVQFLIRDGTGPIKGYTGAAGGPYPYLVENNVVYQHTGSPKGWTWHRLGIARAKVSGNSERVTIPLKRLTLEPRQGGMHLRVLARTMTKHLSEVVSTAYGKATRQHGPTGNAAPQSPTPPAGKHEKLVLIERQGSRLRIRVNSRKGSDLSHTMIFFNTKLNSHTGYQPGTAPHCSFELMAQEGSLYRFAGSSRGQWKWNKIRNIPFHIGQRQLVVKIPMREFKSHRAGVSVWMMSTNWQVLHARWPAHGVRLIKFAALKPSALRMVQHPDANLSPLRRFAAAKSYICYYGAGKVEQLSHVDIAILHRPEMSTRDIRRLNQAGVVTLGYMSVGEDDRLQKGNGRGPGGYASWYFEHQHAGKPDQNGVWHSYFANCGDPAWRHNRLKRAEQLIKNDNFAGLFLDTIGDCTLYPGTGDRKGSVKLVEELRRKFHGCPIVVNRGFALLPSLAPYINGDMFEDFTLTWKKSNHRIKYVVQGPDAMKWTRNIALHELKPLVQKYHLKLLALDYALPEQRRRIQMAADRAATFGMLFNVASMDLNKIYAIKVVGHPIRHWLK